MFNIKLIEAGCVALMLAGLFLIGHHFGAKGVQAKWNAAKVTQLAQQAEAEAKARATEQSYAVQLSKAQNDHTIALQKSQVANAVVAARNVSLRNQLASVTRDLPNVTADACRKYAATANAVLGELGAEAEGLAAAAQGHAADSLMCQQGWPK